jgi:hypothetical protein
MASGPPAAKASQQALLRARLKSTSGGSRDTELKELTVAPTGRPRRPRW